jgi:hypothetical protein
MPNAGRRSSHVSLRRPANSLVPCSQLKKSALFPSIVVDFWMERLHGFSMLSAEILQSYFGGWATRKLKTASKAVPPAKLLGLRTSPITGNNVTTNPSPRNRHRNCIIPLPYLAARHWTLEKIVRASIRADWFRSARRTCIFGFFYQNLGIYRRTKKAQCPIGSPQVIEGGAGGDTVKAVRQC